MDIFALRTVVKKFLDGQQRNSGYNDLEMFESKAQISALNDFLTATTPIEDLFFQLENVAIQIQNVVAEVDGIRKQFRSFQQHSSTTLKVIGKVGEKVFTEFLTNSLEDTYFFALILDPAQKNDLRQILSSREKFEAIKTAFVTQVRNVADVTTVNKNSNFNENIEDSFDYPSNSTSADLIQAEINSYLGLKKAEISGFSSPFDFWQDYALHYPNVSRGARIFE
uniref:Uncharacterized protein n=1 Tax=Acrobeloides nanus TaxID=290746 RepID=A0A914D2F3_9BILA